MKIEPKGTILQRSRFEMNGMIIKKNEILSATNACFFLLNRIISGKYF